jgi:hypothetical protein
LKLSSIGSFSASGAMPATMIVRFPLTQDDHYCLLKHVNKNSTAHEALFNATPIEQPAGEHGNEIWEVICNPDDAIVILKLAHEFCPQAVSGIREGINLST